LAEDGSSALRRWILTDFRLNSFDGFENRQGIFPDVHGRYKFGLIQVERVADPSQIARARFGLTDPGDLADESGRFGYSLADVKLTSPRGWAYFEIPGGEKDLAILKKLYAKFPPLSPDWLRFGNELHATKDKKLFRESPGEGLIPLYKGEAIWQYDPYCAAPRRWVSPAELDGYLLKTQVSRLIGDLKRQFLAEAGLRRLFPGGFSLAWALDFLGLAQERELSQFAAQGRDFPRLAFRAVASDSNERTLIAAILPKGVCSQNSLWLSAPGAHFLDLAERSVKWRPTGILRLLFCQAILNSLPVDWALRASVSMNVNKTYVARLPLPQPSDGEILASEEYLAIARGSAALSLFRQPGLLGEIRPVLEIADLPRVETEEGFSREKAALDVKAARLYGLGADDFGRIVSGFEVLRQKKPGYAKLLSRLAKNSF
jgi:hypothetical protein